MVNEHGTAVDTLSGTGVPDFGDKPFDNCITSGDALPTVMVLRTDAEEDAAVEVEESG